MFRFVMDDFDYIANHVKGAYKPYPHVDQVNVRYDDNKELIVMIEENEYCVRCFRAGVWDGTLLTASHRKALVDGLKAMGAEPVCTEE